MAKKGRKASSPKKKANGYKRPPPIPPGEIIHDRHRKWKIGPSIGLGGFGEIYSAYEYKEGESPPADVSGYPYVVKIEPIENGPLFVEMHFYSRNGDRNDIEHFMKSRNLSKLGMPTYCSSGTHMFRDDELRFLVLERYGKDLWKTFNEVGRKFSAPTVFQLGLQMLDVLDYVHSRSYIHADIKGANILMGMKEGAENQAYLLDFGLAYRIVEDNYKPDPKSAHEGTIEYTSTDRHIGAKTMRGDLEILGYNLLQWLVGELPWEKVLEDPKKVHKMKTDFLNNVRTRIKTDYPNVPDELIKFFEYIKTLEQKDQPDYTKCRRIFETYLTGIGKTRSSQMDFTTTYNVEPVATNQPATTEDMTESRKPTVMKENVERSVASKERKSTEELNTLEAKTSKKVAPSKILKIILTDCRIAMKMNQRQAVTKNKKPKIAEDTPPEIICLSESESVSEKSIINLDKVPKNNLIKRLKDPEIISLIESDSMSELDINKKRKLVKNKKTKYNFLEIISLLDNDAESGQNLEDDQETKTTTKVKKDKNKTDKKPKNASSGENDTQREQFNNVQEQVFVNTKKNKKNTGQSSENAPLEENVTESEQVSSNKKEKATKVKKNKKKKSHDAPTVENDTESEQIHDNQERAEKETTKERHENPKIIPLVQTYVNSEQLDKDQKFTKNKKKKRGKISKDVTVEIIAQSEQLGENQGQEYTNVKKKKKKREENLEVALLIESDDNEQLNNNQKENVAKSIKRKKKYENSAQNNTDIEQLDDFQETKTKRVIKKKKKVENLEIPLPENDQQKDESDVNQDKKSTTAKRTNIQKVNNSEVISSVENSPDARQEQSKMKKNKRRKNKNREFSSPPENDTELQLFHNNQEQKVSKNRQKRDKKTESELSHDEQEQPARKKRYKNSAQNNTDIEQLNDKQETETKKVTKKKKKVENLEIPLPENDEQTDESNDKKTTTVTRSKIQKRNNPEVILSAENSPDVKQEQKDAKTKKNKRRRDKNPEFSSPLENYTEPEIIHDNQEQKVAKKKRKRDKKTESELSVDDHEEPARKKRKSLRLITSKNIDKKKLEGKKYLEVDSENEFQERKTRKKMTKKYRFNEPIQLTVPALPRMETVVTASRLRARVKSLRSNGKNFRPCYV